MTTAPDAPTTILATHEARRAAFESARRGLDARVEALLRRHAAALFRERPGLNAIALAAYQDYDSSQLVGRTYVRQRALEDDAWGPCGFQGECPQNEVDDELAEEFEQVLWRFWRSLSRLAPPNDDEWCLLLRRDPSQADGVGSERREHPGFN